MTTKRNTATTDVLIIGSGGGGLRTAIALAENEVNCLVVGKSAHGDAHTVWAAGGINASLGSFDPEDHWTIHAADTLREGHFLNDPRAVELLCRDAPDRVRELDAWGAGFVRIESGAINQRYFGAQSYRRTCFVGDRTGRAVLDACIRRARELEIPYRENAYIVRLLRENGTVVGALGADLATGEWLLFQSRAVVLAVGGATSLFLRSSSRPYENTGDAQALALEAGAAVRDMEMVQFHPTGKIWPEEHVGELVTEAVRGEGGRLFNANGERFMERYSPEKMELDARDVVARAIYKEIREGRGTEHGGVWLDISHRDAAFIRERLPEMVEEHEALGIDITAEPMEVAPTAHYAMGGARVDFETGATGVPGLFAVGEATSGVHGANRLGGNSLAEIFVFGKRTGDHLAGTIGALPLHPLPDALVEQYLNEIKTWAGGEATHDPEALIHEVQTIMWDRAGILRKEEGVRQGLDELAAVREKAQHLQVSHDEERKSFEQALNLRFMLITAEAILRSALARTESRGAHRREDYPEEDPSWRKHIVCTLPAEGDMQIDTEAVGPIPDEIKTALQEKHELDYHHLE